MKIELPWLSQATVPRPELVRSRRHALSLMLMILAWFVVWYWDTAAGMAQTWLRSDTFAHGMLIVPITMWLVWSRRRTLSVLPLRPNFYAAPVLIVLGAAWVAARLGGVAVIEQYAMVLSIPVCTWLLLGTATVRALAFPLAFLMFAVPFGDFLLPPLMEHTADFTIAALRLSGIPVYREGLVFMLPTGTWSVVEACSGLRYLIASVTVGVLFAYLTFRSATRRALFIAAAIAVPIVANWIRAYAIVMIGHKSSMKYAVGVDHLIYGWLFFGAVMAVLFWIGSMWREDMHGVGPDIDTALQPAEEPPLGRLAAAAVVTAGALAVWPVLDGHLEKPLARPAVALSTPAPAPGWEAESRPFTPWKARFVNATSELAQTYTTGERHVGLQIFYYRNQRSNAELVTSINTLVASTDHVWRNVRQTTRAVAIGDAALTISEAQVRSGSTTLLVWQWYRVAGRDVSRPFMAKLLQAKSMLLRHQDDGAAIIVYSPMDDGEGAAVAALTQFVGAMSSRIASSVDEHL